jgi:type III restriction enzyme
MHDAKRVLETGMDAIECGIVKLPRVPVADNIPGEEMPMYRNLWEHIGKKLPKNGGRKAEQLDPLSPRCHGNR